MLRYTVRELDTIGRGVNTDVRTTGVMFCTIYVLQHKY